MKRREFLTSSAGAGLAFLGVGELARAVSSGGGETGKGGLHLKYAPRLGFLADELSIPQRLEKFSQHGFFAVEYNGLMRHPKAEVTQMRKKLDFLGMEMGIFVANPNGWKTAGLCDPSERANFLADLRQAVEYHRIIGNHLGAALLEQAILVPSNARWTSLTMGAAKAFWGGVVGWGRTI